MIALNKPIHSKNKHVSGISDKWVYEIIDGIPFYRKGYSKFIKEGLTNEIIGCSPYQWR